MMTELTPYTGEESQTRDEQAWSGYQDTPLPFAGSSYRPRKEALPERLRKMRRLFVYGRESLEAKAKNFRRQGLYMQDYEDDAPWDEDFVCYYPTYHDLTTRQLRGYFAWRAHVRRGDYRPIAASAVYLYLYELLNGIGTASPEDSLQRMKDFEEGYLDAGFGDARMRANLRRWMQEYAILQNLPQETVRQVTEPELLQRDHALWILRRPEEALDEELFSALSLLGGKKLLQSPVLSAEPERGRRLFCAVWRKAAGAYRIDDKDLFTLCFGKKTRRRWYPLANALYDPQEGTESRDYILDECRSYHFRRGVWQVAAYEKAAFDRDRFQGLLHEADVFFRRSLKTGRYLQPRVADSWADGFIMTVMEEDRQAALEAARPKIEINLAGLEQIRRDAQRTRDSLLTEEELAELETGEEAAENALPAPEKPETEEPGTENLPDLPLTPVQVGILRALLRGEPAEPVLQAAFLLPSIAADAINEALYDEFGDTVLSCEDDRLSLVEDYREDLLQIFGGTAT